MAIKYSSIGGGSGTGFNVQIGSKYSYATFTQAQPAGAYTIKSSNNYTNWDVYLLDASNNLVAYTGSASIAPTTAFSAIVVVNGTLNDILQFSFASTVFSTATTSQTKAGPFITAFGSSLIPSVNNAVTITGGNFAVGITATFTGTDSVVRTCKSVVYTSTSSISVVRPDVLPVGFAPYTLTLTNPGVTAPTTSNAHILTGLTVGNVPVWSTATSLPAASAGSAYSTTVAATDAEGTVTYSYVSGTLPAGLSFNASTGVISGTYNSNGDGTASYTIRATDNGGNSIDRTFTLAYTGMGGGTLTSDATYYYRTFTTNGSLTVPVSLNVDILMIAGGGGGGSSFGGGGGAGGVVYAPTFTAAATTYSIAVGAGAPQSAAADSVQGSTGSPTTGFGFTCNGGGGGGAYNSAYNGTAGGSGGGGGSSESAGLMSGGAATQGSGSGYTGYGNRGGNSFGRTPYIGTGGGGSGAQGQDITSGNTSGNGGNGLNTFSSWLSGITSGMTGVSGWATATSGGYIASGGAGAAYQTGVTFVGTPGLGGGGTGVTGNNRGGNATESTGSGGGGGGYPTGGGGAGGKGIVIVRYTKASVGG